MQKDKALAALETEKKALEDQVLDLTGQVGALVQENAALAATATDFETLSAQNKALEGQVLELSAQVEALSGQNTELTDKVAAFEQRLNTSSVTFTDQPAPELTRPEFEVRGVRYRFRFGRFHLESGPVLAADVAADPELCALVVAQYPGQVERVTE